MPSTPSSGENMHLQMKRNRVSPPKDVLGDVVAGITKALFLMNILVFRISLHYRSYIASPYGFVIHLYMQISGIKR
jgi:hypothetical protein